MDAHDSALRALDTATVLTDEASASGLPSVALCPGASAIQAPFIPSYFESQQIGAKDSIDADAGGLDWRCPFIDFTLDEGSEVSWRRLIIRHDLRAETFETITHRRRVHRL
jgi:hypothetical protein